MFHIPVNLKPVGASILVLSLAVWGFFSPDRIPLMVSLGLLLIGLLLLLQLKRISISPEELIVKSLATGTTKRIQKSEINVIQTAAYNRHVGRSISPQSRFISVRTHQKQTITISTGSISQTDFDQLIVFLEKHYAEKLD